MVNKTCCILVYLCLFILKMQAQSGFVFKYSSLNDEFPTSIVETSDHGFIISASYGTFPASYQILLIKLNKFGDTIRSRKIEFAGGYSYISNMIKLNNGSYLGIGEKIYPDGKIRMWLINFSEELLLIKDTSYMSNMKNVSQFYCMSDYFQRVLVFGSGTLPNSGYYHPFILTVNQNLDSLNYVCYNPPQCSQHVYSLIEKPDSSGYLMMIFGKYIQQTYSFSQILSMDNSFNILAVDSIPRDLNLYLNSKYINKNRLLITGKLTDNSPTRTDHLAILNLDSTFQVVNEYYLGPEDTISYPAAYTNLDFVNPNEIFYGGTVNFNIGTIFSNMPSSILLGKFDSTLNLYWEKSFGGDQYYIVYTLTALEEGGCIIGASSFNYNTQTQERDIYVIKVDSNGLITSVDNKNPESRKNALIFPNPGNEILNVQLTCQTAEIVLYDITGNKILNKSIGHGFNSIDVSNLLPGLYLYRITDSNSKVQQDKWIKK